jgi:hypothetical protein
MERWRHEFENSSRTFGVKLAPEFFDAELIICVTFLDKPGEGSTQVTGFKIWQRIVNLCSS